MERQQRTGMEFIEGFAILAGAMWVLGAMTVGGMVLLSGAPQTGVTPASNQTGIGESNNTPTTESVQTVDGPAEQAPEGETPATP